MSRVQLETMRHAFIELLNAGQAPAGYSWPEYQVHLTQMIAELDRLIEREWQRESHDAGEVISGGYS